MGTQLLAASAPQAQSATTTATTATLLCGIFQTICDRDTQAKYCLIRPVSALQKAKFRGSRARLRIYAGQKGDFRRCGPVQDGARVGNLARAGDVRGIGAFIRSSQDRTTHSKDFDDTVRHYRPCVDRGPRRWRGPSEQDKRAHGVALPA